MKKLRKRIFAAVLAALMMITAMPGTALYAAAETETVPDNAIEQAGTEGTEETVDGDTEEPGTDDAGETGDGNTEEPAQEPPAGPLEEDSVKCICKVLCAEDSINGDCPVCGADNASLLDCEGKDVEENADQPEDTGVCRHHQEHDDTCGYQPASEDGEGSPCTYACRICPIEALIAALPDTVTEDNADDVRARLDEILDLYRELDEDEQEQIDLSRCYELQEALDNANAPMTAEGSTDQQTGAEFTGSIKTYNGAEETTSFGASDTITVKAAPTPTGAAPTNSAMFAASFTAPGAGQMAVFVNDTQVSEPVNAVDGTYTMTVSASDVLTLGGVEPNGGPITLTAKFVRNDNMADAAGTVKVNISAVARVEKDSSTFTLDLNGQTVKATYPGRFLISGGSITIQDSGTGGKIEGSNTAIEVTGGTLSIKRGTVSGFYGVQITSGTVNISGGVISGAKNGLWVNGSGNIALSGGTYNSERHAIWVDGNASVTLKDMLAPGYAYHQNDIPIAKAEGSVGEVPFDTKPAWLSDAVTVEACTHSGVKRITFKIVQKKIR